MKLSEELLIQANAASSDFSWLSDYDRSSIKIMVGFIETVVCSSEIKPQAKKRTFSRQVLMINHLNGKCTFSAQIIN